MIFTGNFIQYSLFFFQHPPLPVKNWKILLKFFCLYALDNGS